MTTTALVKTDNNKQITGRHTKLTPEVQDKICQIIAAGHYLITACNAVGINKSTYLRWMERAEYEANNGGGLYCDFSLAIKKAEAEAEQKLLAVVSDKAINAGEWLPAMTILERRHPERWGRKDRSTLVVEETKQIVITTVEVVKDYGNRKIEEKT